MQQPPQLMNITTEQIQKYLDENKELIMAIMENQNQGKLAESASYQAQLQQNLMYLAKIADSQPQASASASSQPLQMPPQSAIPQEQHVQSAQAAMAKQHPCFLAPNGTYLGVQTGMGNNFMNIQGNKQDSSEDGGGEGFRKSSYGRDNMRA
ncbi:hypothetical protein GOBAR_DD10203 [Gossypium barbadense]|nr:hypothetical protein GOBAR_DD10203 [Gossypium barbadense]